MFSLLKRIFKSDTKPVTPTKHVVRNVSVSRDIGKTETDNRNAAINATQSYAALSALSALSHQPPYKATSDSSDNSSCSSSYND